MKIFISYSSQNLDIAGEICDVLETSDMECFIAPRNIRGGYSYAEEIIRGIDESDILLLLLSEESNASNHVLREVERFVNSGKPILTYRLSEVELSKSLEYFLMPFQWLDMKDDPLRSKLVEGLTELYEKQSSEEESAVREPLTNVRKKAKPWKISTFILAALLCLGLCGFFILLRSGKLEFTSKDADIEEVLSPEAEAALREAEELAMETEKLQALKVGDTVSFGRYLDEPLEWRVLELNGDEALLITKYVFTMKCFDSAESGYAMHTSTGEMREKDVPFSSKQYIEAYGSNRWATSNLRTWLNSALEVVEYEDSAPIKDGMTDYSNGYNLESGFLYNFSVKEIEAIIPVVNSSDYYNGDTGEYLGKEESEDLIFIPSYEDIEKLKAAGMSIYVKPTETAISQNLGTYYNTHSLAHNIEMSDYWVRECLEGTAWSNIHVTNGYTEEEYGDHYSSVDGCGVRAMVKVKLVPRIIIVK